MSRLELWPTCCFIQPNTYLVVIFEVVDPVDYESERTEIMRMFRGLCAENIP